MIGIAVGSTAIEYEYRFAEHEHEHEHEQDEIRWDAGSLSITSKFTYYKIYSLRNDASDE